VEELEDQVFEQQKQIKKQKEASELKVQLDELQATLWDTKEACKLDKANLEKQIAVQGQKLNFYETQLKEADAQQKENKKSYDALMKAFKSLEAAKDNSEGNIHDIIQQQRSEYIEEISNLQSKFNDTRQRLAEQVEKLTSENNDLALDLKVRTAELQRDNEQFKQQVEELTQDKSKLEEALKQLESEKLNLIDSIESHYKEKIDRLEGDLNAANMMHQEALDELNDEKEGELKQMKAFYEEEKQRLEVRINDERKKSKLKLDQLQEEHEDAMREEQEIHEEEVEALHQEIKNIEERYQEELKQAEQRLVVSMQKIEFLESSLKDAKDSLADYHRNSSETLNKQLENFAKERSMIKATLEKEFEKKKQDLAKDKEELKESMNALSQELEQLRLDNQSLKDDLVKQKLEFTREEAIVNQKLQFKDEKIRDLSEANQTLTQQYEERISELKNELIGEMQNKVTKLENENNTLKERIQEKKDHIRDLELELDRIKSDSTNKDLVVSTIITSLVGFKTSKTLRN
jgi:chromosome segregation ATPase